LDGPVLSATATSHPEARRFAHCPLPIAHRKACPSRQSVGSQSPRRRTRRESRASASSSTRCTLLHSSALACTHLQSAGKPRATPTAASPAATGRPHPLKIRWASLKLWTAPAPGDRVPPNASSLILNQKRLLTPAHSRSCLCSCQRVVVVAGCFPIPASCIYVQLDAAAGPVLLSKILLVPYPPASIPTATRRASALARVPATRNRLPSTH